MTNPLRLLKLYRRADAVVDVLDDGAQHPTTYRTPAFWTRLTSAAIGLASLLPLPKGTDMTSFWQKLLMVTGAIFSIGSQVQGMQLPLPPKVQAGIGLAIAIAGGIYHAVPGQLAAPVGPQATGAK